MGGDQPQPYGARVTNLLILGAGTAGTILANRLARSLDDGWNITIVDRDDEHHYQPGYLFIPFGKYKPSRGGTTAFRPPP